MHICGNVLYFWDRVPKSMCTFMDGYTFNLCLREKEGQETQFPCYRWGIEGPRGFSQVLYYTRTQAATVGTMFCRYTVTNNY